MESFPGILDTCSLANLLTTLEEHAICAGPDDHFVELIKAKRGKILSPDGTTAAMLDNTQVQLDRTFYSQTVRTSQCE